MYSENVILKTTNNIDRQATLMSIKLRKSTKTVLRKNELKNEKKWRF